MKTLPEKISELEGKIFESKLKDHAKVNNLGWGYGMRCVKMPKFTRTDNLIERLEKLKKAVVLALILIISSYTIKAQNIDESKTNYFVAGFNAGYNLKYPVAGLQFGYRFNDVYLSINQYIPLVSDAEEPKIFSAALGYNINSFQPFISYSYHTIGREKESYFKYSNAFHVGFGVSYYPVNMPLAFTAQRTGNKTIFSLTLYKAL